MGKFEKDSIKGAGAAIATLALAMLIIFILSVIFSSCRTRYITTEIPVVLHNRDSIVQVQHFHTHDTLMMRDSVLTYIKGDTVRIERWHTLQSINNIVRTDTIYIDKESEKPVTITEHEVVEVNRLTWWQKTLAWLGGITLLLGGGWVFLKIRR